MRAPATVVAISSFYNAGPLTSWAQVAAGGFRLLVGCLTAGARDIAIAARRLR